MSSSPVPLASAWRPALGAALVFCGLLPWTLGPRPADARITACRTDPIVSLSNGALVRMTATIADDVADVTSIVYTLHVPVGVSMRDVTYTRGPLGIRESVQVLADLPGGYWTDTLVSTNTNGVPVDASTSVSAGSSGDASGLSGQYIRVDPSR